MYFESNHPNMQSFFTLQGRFNIIKKKSSSRCETPTFVADAVAKAVEAATEERITERIKTAKETIDFGGSEDNSLLEKKSMHSQPVVEGGKDDAKEDVKEDAKKDIEEDEQTSPSHKSEFRKWVESHPVVEPTKPRAAQENLGKMWLDFVETRVMKSFFCSAACGNFDDETTAASTTTYNSEDDLAAYALSSTPREEEISPRKRASKSRKRKSSQRTRRTRHDKR